MIGHIGVQFKQHRYAGVEFAVKVNGKYKYTIFHGKYGLSQDFMDAVVYGHTLIVRNKLATVMMSSSVDHYVMDTRPWCWAENGLIGEYIVPMKSKDEAWHHFTKIYVDKDKNVPTQFRKHMYVQHKGGALICEGPVEWKGSTNILPTGTPLSQTWQLFMPDADEPLSVFGTIDKVQARAAKAKVEKKITLGG